MSPIIVDKPASKGKPKQTVTAVLAPPKAGNGHDGDGDVQPVGTTVSAYLKGGSYDRAQTFIDVCYGHPEGRTLHRYRNEFCVWTGTHWREVDEEEIRTRLYAFINAARVQVLIGVDENGKKRWATQPCVPTRKMIADLMDALRSRAFLSDQTEMPSWLGKPTTRGQVIPLRNGLLDLGTGYLHAHSPRYLQSYALAFDYDPLSAKPVEWLAFLSTVWPDDPETIATLQEIMGLLMTGDTSYQKLFMLVGPPRSGKGTIARVLHELLGRINVAGPTLSSLVTNFGLQPLIGKPVAIISDARLSGRTDSAAIAETLLSISGEDLQSVHRKNKTALEVTLPTRFLVMTNILPKIADSSGAMVSRIVMLLMTNSFLGKEDHSLMDKLKPELAGIFNWTLAGLARLSARRHFVVPESSQDAVEEMQRQSAPIMSYIKECCTLNPAQDATVDALYERWCRWCTENGQDRAGTKGTFGINMRAAMPGLKITQHDFDGRKRRYVGIYLK